MLKLALIFLLCFIPRLAYLSWAVPGDPPAIYYWAISDSMLSSGVLGFDGHPSTAFEPLYPLFLALARLLTSDSLFGVMLLQIALASAGAVYLYRLCLHLAGDERTAWIAVLLYSSYPYLVRQAASVIEITLLTSLLIATAYHYSTIENLKGAAAAGAALAAVFLARAAALPVLVFAIAWLVLRKRYAQAIVAACTLLVLVLPVSVRNYQLDGSLMYTRAGDSLYSGNSEESDKVIPQYNVDLIGKYARARLVAEAPELSHASEREIDAFYARKALEFAAKEPLRTLRLKLLNIWYFFHPRIVPFYAIDEKTTLTITADGRVEAEGVPARSEVGEWAHSVAFSVIFLTALAGVWIRRRDGARDAILYGMLFSFLLVCIVYFPATRLRVPVDFVLMFFSAAALARWLRSA